MLSSAASISLAALYAMHASRRAGVLSSAPDSGLIRDADRLPDRLGLAERVQHQVRHVGARDAQSAPQVAAVGRAIDTRQRLIHQLRRANDRPVESTGPHDVLH